MIADKALDVGQNLATQKVIGYSRSVTRKKGKKNPKIIQENISVGIQAWEIGIILAGVAAYEYVNGSGSLLENLTSGIKVNQDPSVAYNSMPGVRTILGGK